MSVDNSDWFPEHETVKSISTTTTTPPPQPTVLQCTSVDETLVHHRGCIARVKYNVSARKQHNDLPVAKGKISNPTDCLQLFFNQLK